MLLPPWDSPGKSTGVGCHFLPQGIFPTQGSNPGLLHCRQTLLPSEPPGKYISHLLFTARFSVWASFVGSLMTEQLSLISPIGVEKTKKMFKKKSYYTYFPA